MHLDLVGGIPTPLRNMKVNWDDDIPNIWENKTCSKPPTRFGQIMIREMERSPRKEFDGTITRPNRFLEPFESTDQSILGEYSGF